MRKVLFMMVISLSILCATFSYAQMGGGMMGGQGQMGSGMMQGQGAMGSGMMGSQEMMQHMMQNMNQMSGMMQEMSSLMNKGMDAAHMNQMSGIMGEMSKQMMDMSGMMKQGQVPQKDMQQLRQRMMDTEKNFNMMKK